MAEHIEREAAMTTPVLPKKYRRYQTDNLDDAYEQGWFDALDNLKNVPAVSVPQWISVKDRLPENECDVLICAKRKYYNKPDKWLYIVVRAFYTDGKHYTEDSNYVWDVEYIDMEYLEEKDAYLIPEGWWESVEYAENFSAVDDFVEYWMPLPEPPKGDVDNG